MGNSTARADSAAVSFAAGTTAIFPTCHASERSERRSAKDGYACPIAGENSLWINLVYSSADSIERTFAGETAVSLGAVWTDSQSPETWWPLWEANQMQAYNDGQILLVYCRRQWEQRLVDADLTVAAEDNISWPGKALTLTQNAPLAQYGDTQAREICWLEQKVREGVFSRDRVLYRAIESLDEVRHLPSVLAAEWCGRPR